MVGIVAVSGGERDTQLDVVEAVGRRSMNAADVVAMLDLLADTNVQALGFGVAVMHIAA